MQFSENEIERFAAWSGDHNPLYVDREFAQTAGYREPLVPGMLAAFGAFACVAPHATGPLATLDIQFRGPLVPDAPCDIAWTRGPCEFSLTVRQRGAELLTIVGEPLTDAGAPSSVDLSWFQRLQSDRKSRERGRRTAPNDRHLEDLHSGFAVSGVYATDPPPETASSSGCLTPVQARVLGLCGYLVGMEAPGLRSTFVRARLRFVNSQCDASQLWYRARTLRFDEVTRLLDTEIEVATPDGELLASGELQSAVRLDVPATNLEALTARLTPDVNRLAGKVALVCGGSRNLGADLAAALALAGCKVYVGFQKSSAAAAQLAKRLAERDAAIELLQGDAGDPDWCSSALEIIDRRHGRLDILVLNAGSSSPPVRISTQSARHFDDYLRSNLRLAWMPLATCLPILEESSGAVVCISSSLAARPQAGFAHDVALKQAVEGVVQTATRESPRVWSLIVRPQRSIAGWIGAGGDVAAISSDAVAVRVLNRLAAEWRPGEVEWLADNPAAATPERIDQETPAKRKAIEIEFADEFELPLTEGLDADSILVSMDALIAAELAAPPALVGESDHLHHIEEDRQSMPALSEIDHWHEESGATSSDVPAEECPPPPEKPVAQRLLTWDQVGPSEFPQEPSPEGRLHELLKELHTEITDAVGTPDAAEPAVEKERFGHEAPFFLDDASESDTHPMLDIVSDDPNDEPAVLDESADSCDETAAVDRSLEADLEDEAADIECTWPVPEVTSLATPTAAEVATAPANHCDQERAAESEIALEPGNSKVAGVSQPPAPEVAYDITGYEAGIGEEIDRFEEQVAPLRRADQWLDSWKWRHIESARRLAMDPRVWVYRETGKVLAWSGAIPVRLKIGSEERLTPWVTWQTPPDADRDREIARRLLIRAVDEFPFGLSLARTEQSRALLKQSGWVEVAPLESAELMLNPDAVLQRKRDGSATLGEWGWRAATAVRTLLRHRARVNVQPVGRFEERHDRLWQFAAREVTCGIVRDSSWLNWKYVDQPAQEILRLEVIDGSSLLGVVVLTFREADEARPYRHAVLSELLARLSDAESLSKLFEVASAAAAERNADAVLCEHAGQALTRALRQNGFVIGRSGRYLFVNPGQLTPEVRSQVVAGKDWLLTAGDVDL
jgi:NAD(P)-dependent dehydrogenase (short-subunit alcohol dehydrogenase family)